MGNTHGVNASSRPKPKKLATSTQTPPLNNPAISASSDCGSALGGTRAGRRRQRLQERRCAGICGRRRKRGKTNFGCLFLRQVAHADIGATLRHRFQLEITHCSHPRAVERQHETHVAAISFELAEKFVSLDFAGRQLRGGK